MLRGEECFTQSDCVGCRGAVECVDPVQRTWVRWGKGVEDGGWVVCARGEDDAGVGLVEVELCEAEAEAC